MIARIITKSKNVETYDFVTVGPDSDNITEDVPTLIIGKTNAEEICGKSNVKVLDRQIAPNLWWVYAKTDRRDAYEDSIEKFNKYIIDYLGKQVKYRHFNLFTEPFSRVKDMIRFMDGNERKYVYVGDKEIFIYCRGTVVGLSMDEIEYCGVAVDKAVSRIFRNPSNVRCGKRQGQNRYLMKFNRKANYIMPYLCYLEEKQ